MGSNLLQQSSPTVGTSAESPGSASPTLYFGYGSNLWLHQMEQRCPTSKYLGVAKLDGYRWIINERGYANVVEIPGDFDEKTDGEMRKQDEGKYEDCVFGLVYELQPADEERLDRNEGVPYAYTKELLPCAFWPTDSESTELAVDSGELPKEGDDAKLMLVYIDRLRTDGDFEPKKEYVYRMNMGIRDAVECGVPKKYVESVLRRWIPEVDLGAEGMEVGKGKRRSVELAMKQAVEFQDES